MTIFTRKKLAKLEAELQRLYTAIQGDFDDPNMTATEAVGTLVTVAQGHIQEAIDYLREAQEEATP